jgi:[ribosomal protein S5]-alanine N-acetyltransferase
MHSDIFPPILTDRLELRCHQADDAVPMVGLMTPAISRWLATWPAQMSEDAAARRIAGARRWADDRRAVPLTLVQRDNSAVVGFASVTRNPTAPDRATLGYWLAESVQGLGLMREAAPAIVRAGFELLDINVLDAAVQIANRPSLAVLRGLGMRHTGDAMVPTLAGGSDEACHLFELDRSAWAARAAVANNGQNFTR